MSKKTMMLALAVAALFAIPSAAAAQEIHFKNVTSFTGTGPASFLVAVNQPKISCTATKASGSFNAGSSTTGTNTVTFSGCTAEQLGIKGNCNTAGDATGTITTSEVFHLITTSTSKPGILWTPVTTTVTCIGFSRIEFTGNGLIGTITSPACGGTSNNKTLVFEQSGGTQNHLVYTGVKYDLSGDTENSEGVTSGPTATAGFEGSVTLTSASAGTLECT
jgi:hypothetical protein